MRRRWLMQLPDWTLSVWALRSPLISCTTRKEYIPGEGAALHNYTLSLKGAVGHFSMDDKWREGEEREGCFCDWNSPYMMCEKIHHVVSISSSNICFLSLVLSPYLFLVLSNVNLCAWGKPVTREQPSPEAENTPASRCAFYVHQMPPLAPKGSIALQCRWDYVLKAADQPT